MTVITNNRSRSRGFTLIELMIVIVVIAILASIAVPAYTAQMIKSRRTDAQREVVSLGQALERWFSTNGTYLNAAGTDCGVLYTGHNAYYGIVPACHATTFIITATPDTSGPQLSDGTLILDQTGAKSGSENGGSWKY